MSAGLPGRAGGGRGQLLGESVAARRCLGGRCRTREQGRACDQCEGDDLDDGLYGQTGDVHVRGVELGVEVGGSRVEDGRRLADPVQGGEGDRGTQVGTGVAAATPGEVEGGQAEQGAHGHRLAVVELGVCGPERIEHVRVVPVGEVGRDGREDGDQREQHLAGHRARRDGGPGRHSGGKRRGRG